MEIIAFNGPLLGDVHMPNLSPLAETGSGPNPDKPLAIIVAGVLLLLAAMGPLIFNIWFERKQVSRIQDRLGPNRAGPWGIFQSIADVLKLFTKEIIIPSGIDKVSYWLAPVLGAASVIMIWAVLPLSPVAIGSDLNVGALYFIAISSLGVIGVLMAGWGSNNKYALLGGLRMVAQVVSYEVPLMLALLVPILLAGSLSMQEIVDAQNGMWFAVLAPVACLLFLVAGQAEVGRAPFDLTEGESEIIAGYHIEYSGLAFAMFYLAEWLHAFTLSALAAALFFGGWQGPGATDIPALGLVYFFGKTYLVYFVLNWLRFTVPRVRIDHLMSFNWKFLTPIALVNLVMIACLEKVWPELFSIDPNASAFVQALPRTGVLFLSNIVLAGVILLILREVARRERQRVEDLVDEGEYSVPPVQATEAEI